VRLRVRLRLRVRVRARVRVRVRTARARVRARWSVGRPRALESALPLAPSMVEKMGACVISRLSGSR
jgi:hypothetical protein